MERIEHYKEFTVRAFEREPERWRAEISKINSTDLIILLPDGGPRRSITTSADTLTADAAITLAKLAIDGGGMK